MGALNIFLQNLWNLKSWNLNYSKCWSIQYNTYSVTSFIQSFEGIFSNLVKLGLSFFTELGQVFRSLIKVIGEANLLGLKHGDLCQKLLALSISFGLGIGGRRLVWLLLAEAQNGSSCDVVEESCARGVGWTEGMVNGLQWNHLLITAELFIYFFNLRGN